MSHQSSAPPQIPGRQISNHDAEPLKNIVADLLQRDSIRFPGAQPVSFARQHLNELTQKEYFMCEKTDGVRCLLFLTYKDGPEGFEPVTFMIDRKNNYYEVLPPLRFPYHGFPEDADKFLFNTILDGELVHDRVRGDPTGVKLIYYVFDCLVIDSANYTTRPLDKRIGYMKQKIFDVKDKVDRDLVARGHHPPHAPFEVKMKQVYSPYNVNHMFHEVLPSLPHGNDGLVFTCKSTGYKFGTDEHILKWKPPHENTIDFKLRLGNFPTFDPEDGEEGMIEDYDSPPDRFQLLVLHNNNNYVPFEHDLFVPPADWAALKSLNQRLDGRIIECYRDDAGRWRYKREDDGSPRWRDDKKDANHISTVKSVLDSIEDPVTEQDLVGSESRIREAVQRLRKEEQWAQREQVERDAKKRKLSDMNGGH